ncbi:hypothetical protein XENOCAPTIV_014811, partial [Xenoophorus captivus]
VAVVSSDGVLRLDLDLENAMMPNGTNIAKTDGSETSETAVFPAVAAEKQSVSTAVEKKVIKPPMPPTKEAKSSFVPENEPNKQDEIEVCMSTPCRNTINQCIFVGIKWSLKTDLMFCKVLKPPMPPSKESKPCVIPGEEVLEDENTSVKKNTGPPPTPPNKPSSNGSLSNLTEVLPNLSNSHPPTPPPKDKKPSQIVVEPNQQTQDAAVEKKEMEGEDEDETARTVVGNDEVDQFEETGQNGEPKSTTDEDVFMQDGSCDINDQQEPQGPEREKLSLLTSNKSPKNPVQPDIQLEEDPSSPQSNPFSETLNLSPLFCHVPGEKKKKAEEKSVDSGQHSDIESEGSVNEDTLAASTAALRGSHAGLEVLDATEDESQTSVNLRPLAELQVRPNVIPCRRSEPFGKPLKPSSKPRSASIGDLLSDSPGCNQKKISSKTEDGCVPTSKNDVTKLETEVALEMKKTSELLNQAQERSYAEVMPEDLLAKALEKLQKADSVLREVKKLKLAKTLKRMSW